MRAALLSLGFVVLLACESTAEERAAQRAVDACIRALEPVADQHRPSRPTVRVALRDADAAARTNPRWAPLRARLSELDTALQAETGERAVDALVRECQRVNAAVKGERGGTLAPPAPPAAPGS